MNIRHFTILCSRLLTLLIVYSFIRIAFYIVYFELYIDQPFTDIAGSFFHGVRFDIAALCWINAPLFLLLPFRHKIPKIDRFVFYFLNTLGVLAGLVDLKLFHFNGKRLSKEFFTSLQKDFWDQLAQVAFYYWYIPVVMIVIAYFIFKLDQRFDRTKTNRIASWKLALPLWILSLALAFVGIRGGMQGRSINILTAFNEGAFELGHLRLNTPFYFLRTYNIPRVKKKNWYTETELEEKIQNLRIKSQYQGLEKQNVVLIILESFSQEYVEEGYAPFLLELSQQGLYFSQNFANGRRSIEVLSSVLDGIPSIQDVPFSRSSPQAMPVTGFVKRLKEKGYQTSFFHGANVFTMGFKNYALAHGVDNYYSREDYDGPESDFDGNWGIFDGPYLDFTARKLSQTKEPFFAGFLSISSHHPFNLPEEYKDKFPSDGLPIHKTIRYTDQMLREFFEKIKKLIFIQILCLSSPQTTLTR
jgi:phosphoglycerol transferase MdoB-like AlkP superfamily enzyme